MNQSAVNLLNNYLVHARLLPGILTASPVLIIGYFISQDPNLNSLVDYILSVNFLGYVSISFAFLYLHSQVSRVTSKYFENKYFRRAKGFPTTYLMAYQDGTLSSSYKDKYRAALQRCFNVSIPSVEDELQDPSEAKKLLDEATGLVVAMIGEKKLVKKHNIWYGFFRNLTGGAIFGSVFSLIGIAVGAFVLSQPLLWGTCGLLLLLYVILLVFHKPILVQNAEAYAQKLFSEFLLEVNRK